jgi:hypothetical protein
LRCTSLGVPIVESCSIARRVRSAMRSAFACSVEV